MARHSGLRHYSPAPRADAGHPGPATGGTVLLDWAGGPPVGLALGHSAQVLGQPGFEPDDERARAR
eukprot:6072197-Alexandrium_andersonii.AAC.1